MNNDKNLLQEPKTLVDFYNIKRLSQIIDPEIIKITAAGFTGIICSPITIVEPRDGEGVELFEGTNITEFLAKECQASRRNKGEACMHQRRKEMKEFIDDLTASPICYCYDKGIHLRKPIEIGGNVVALALGGGYRIENDPPLEIVKEYVDYLGKLLSSRNKNNKRLTFEGIKIKVKKYDGSSVDEISCKYEYNKFAEKVKAIEKLAQEVFRARRLAREGTFLSELFGLTKMSYTATTREEEFKEMLVLALERINTFCGFNKSLLLIRKDDEAPFKHFLSVGFRRGNGIYMSELQMDKNWENFVQNERITFMSNDLDINILPRSLFWKGEYDLVQLFSDIKVLMQAPKAYCGFAYPVKVSRDYNGIFIFINETQEKLYVKRSFKETKTFLDRVMEHLSTILKRHHAQIVSRIFFDRLSHEVLAPVGAIRSRAEFLQKRFNDLPDYLKRTKLNDLLQECDKLVDLSERFSILDEKKKISLDRKMTAFLDEIVKPTVFLLRPEAQKKGISISYDEKIYEIPKLFVDPNKVKELFFNIIMNAIKYSFKDTEIYVGCKKDKNGYNYFVENYGVGIPEGEDQMIFKVRVRGSNASEIDARGGGMGLPICEEIIKAHGGRIWFERGEEKGRLKKIIFWIFFP